MSGSVWKVRASGSIWKVRLEGASGRCVWKVRLESSGSVWKRLEVSGRSCTLPESVWKRLEASGSVWKVTCKRKARDNSNGGQEPHLVARWLLKTRPFRPFQQKGPPRDYSGFGGNQHQNGSPDWAKGRRDVCRARFWLRATPKKRVCTPPIGSTCDPGVWGAPRSTQFTLPGPLGPGRRSPRSPPSTGSRPSPFPSLRHPSPSRFPHPRAEAGPVAAGGLPSPRPGRPAA